MSSSAEYLFNQLFLRFFFLSFDKREFRWSWKVRMKRWIVAFFILQCCNLYKSAKVQCTVANQLYYDPIKDPDGVCVLGCQAGKLFNKEIIFKFLIKNFLSKVVIVKKVTCWTRTHANAFLKGMKELVSSHIVTKCSFINSCSLDSSK